MTEKTYKCGFKHCQHENNEVIQSEAVKVGGRYMHKDCAVTNENILKIRDLYFDKVSNTVVIKELVSVINNLIFKKHVDSEFVLFALNHAMNSKIPIKSPYGLHYLIDNQRIKQLWNKKKSEELVSNMKKENEKQEVVQDMVKFKFMSEDSFGFDSIFKGGN